MSRGNTDSLTRISGVIALQEKDAALAFAHCLQKQTKHRQQIDELIRYRQEYSQQLGGNSAGSLSAGRRTSALRIHRKIRRINPHVETARHGVGRRSAS